jgi:uncharacterized protein (TIGR03435 family)
VKSNHSLAALISLSLAVGPVIALGQEAATASSFDVVSIRQGASDTEKRDGQPEVEVTGDGWRLNDEPLFAAIINAYTPPSGGAAFYTPRQIVGLPNWAMEQQYVIDAKIGEEDIGKWHDPATQTELLHAMMRAMLADRCKLVIHRESKEVPIYSLVWQRTVRSSKNQFLAFRTLLEVQSREAASSCPATARA